MLTYVAARGDVEPIAQALNQRYSLSEMATKYHHVISTIFGEEVRSSDTDGAIKSQTKDFLAESIVMVRGESSDQIPHYLRLRKDELRRELEDVLREYVILNPKVTTNIGPIIHLLLAIAYNEYDSVNSTFEGS